MEIVITGRRVDVTDRFRETAQEKLQKISQFSPRAIRVDVELSHERNPRQSHTCEKVEITVHAKGPVVRAEACAEDPAAALDLAIDKLLERLRRMGDRRKVHHGRHTPVSVHEALSVDRTMMPTPELVGAAVGGPVADGSRALPTTRAAEPRTARGGEGGTNGAERVNGVVEMDEHTGPGHWRDEISRVTDAPDDCPVVIRSKEHHASPMTLDQALYEMELVGHDFFLFVDAENGRPSVVYRRRGWDYGVIRLDLAEAVSS